MESSSIYNHLQDHQLVDSSSSPSNSSLANTSYGVGTTAATHASWNSPYSMLNVNGLHQQECSTVLSSVPFNTNMAPDLSSHWANNTGNGDNFTNNSYEDHQDLQNPRVKVFADNYYLKYTEMLSSSPPSTTTDEYVLRNEQPHDATTKLLLKSLSSPAGSLYSNNSLNNSTTGTRGFSQIFPSINVSNLNHHQNGMTNQGPFDMNLQALDLLTSSRFSGSFNPSSHDQIGVSYGFDHIPQQHEMPFYTSNKMPAPSSTRGSLGAEGKRSSNKMDQPKVLQGTATKKSRVEARSSCPPFKVRKEKLGDRIAALQQLVSPFGKTDTASVLMEATGYIRFLQEQVETLSVPYMKKPRKNAVNSRVVKGGGDERENKEETKRDLRSRGLCLVPLSCLSYITDSGGGGVWPPPPHFGGAA